MHDLNRSRGTNQTGPNEGRSTNSAGPARKPQLGTIPEERRERDRQPQQRVTPGGAPGQGEAISPTEGRDGASR